MKRLIFAVILSVIISALISSGMTLHLMSNINNSNKPEVKTAKTESEKIYDRYTIEYLSRVAVPESKINLGKEIEETEDYTAYLFEHEFDPTFEDDDKKTVTGRINIPNGNGRFPVILMIRGFVDQEIYETGMGTENASKVFAKKDFITLAPDFLGYAGSSEESKNIFETRFQTYTTAMSVLSAIGSLKEWDNKNIFIWGHSNGGQVVLTLLAITGKAYPATLWAPVTKPFPYSVLYYTDDSLDGGKYIRSELAKIEEIYDIEAYSFTNYLDKIKSPITLHQGTGDDAVPYNWNSDFSKRLEKSGVTVTYFEYPGADHNMKPAWDTVVERDINFFNSNLN